MTGDIYARLEAAGRDKALMEAHQPAIWHFTPAPGLDKMTRQKRLDLLYWARTLKMFVSYLWRCEEYGGLAQIAHGVELGPENKSFTIDCGFVGQSLGVACAEGVQYFIHHQRCIETAASRWLLIRIIVLSLLHPRSSSQREDLRKGKTL